MALIRSPTKTWIARDGKVLIADAHTVTISNSSTLSGSFASLAGAANIEAACVNITITPPETAYEKVDLLGKDSGNFQNQLLDEKPVGIATFTGTLLMGEDETIEDFIVSGTPSIAGPAGYTRYQIGRTSENEIALCVTMQTSDASNMVTFALDNARVTKYGDVRIGGADGHWEQDLTAICLAKDFYVEFKD